MRCTKADILSSISGSRQIRETTPSNNEWQWLWVSIGHFARSQRARRLLILKFYFRAFFLCVCVFEFVVNNKAKALLAGWLFPQKNECACSSLKKAFEAYLEMTKTLIFPLMKL